MPHFRQKGITLEMLSQKKKIVQDDGGVLLNVNAAVEALNSGASIKDIYLLENDEIERFNNNAKLFGLDQNIELNIIDHNERQNNWNYPSLYDGINLEEYFLSKCQTDEQKNRVLFELDLYNKRKMNNLLRWTIYFMDEVYKNDLFIGVGRGSSVSSYCLFLIGIHLIDSLKYELDPIEFFKET